MATALLLSLVFLGPGSVGPQLEWSGDDVCPGAPLDLERALPAYLGEAAEPESVEAVLGIIDAGPAGLRLQLRMVSRFGMEQHELAAIDCDQLIDQAALLIAGVIDPFMTATAAAWPAPSTGERRHEDVPIQQPRSRALLLEPDPHPNDAAVLDEPKPAPISSEFGPIGALEAVDPSRDRRAPIVGAIGVGATAFTGVFPQVGGGAELEGVLERGPLRWQNSLSGWFGGRFRAADVEVGADLWALAFATSVCGVPAVSRVRLPLCAVVGVGTIRARAVGTVDPRSSTQPWAWAGAELGLQVLARQDLAVALGLGAHAILIRPAWEIRAPDVSYRIPPVMGVLRLIFEIRELGAKKTTTSEIATR